MTRRNNGLQRLATLLLLVCIAVAFSACEASSTNDESASSAEGANSEPAADELVPSAELAGNGAVADIGDFDLRLLKHVMVMVQTKYYDPDRVAWRKMSTHAFDALQSRLAEVVADFDAPLEDTPTKVTLRVNTQTKTFALEEVDSLSSAHGAMVGAVAFVADHLVEDTPVAELEYTVINGMLDTLDPHSVLLTPDVFEDMQTTHGGFAGLGIVIGIRDEHLTVISPIEGTPASKAGLKAKDQIVRIGEESTVNMPIHEAVDRLRGKEGTAVDIDVLRKGWTEPRTYTITRARIEVRSLVTHALADDKIAYIKIKSFEENTGEDIRKKLAEMRAEMGGIDGLILDLRFNAGGLLNQAISVADTFLPGGKTVVVSEGVGGKQREEEKSTDIFTEPEYPIVVIVNPGSASASEIVAGALKNHDRAVTIGETTFGKGSVQILQENDDGSAIKLTIAQYLTPGDVSIQGVGIAPDIRVAPVMVTEEDVDLFVSENIRREGNLELALSSEKTRAADQPLAVLRYLWDPDEEFDESSEAFREDFEIRVARQMLGATRSSARPAFLEAVQPQLEGLVDTETAHIVEALEARDVDWTRSDGDIPSQPLTVALSVDGKRVGDEPSGVVAGETMKFTASVTNDGESVVERLFAITHSNNPVFDDRELIFGRIAPGQTQSWTLEVKLPRGMETRVDPVELSFGDRNGELETTATAVLAIEGLPQPRYAVSYQVDDREMGNGDGLLQVGETVDLRVVVKNVGEGESQEALSFLKNESGGALYLERGRATIGEIGVGELSSGTMRFKVNHARKKEPGIAFELNVYDKEFGARVENHVVLDLVDAETATLQGADGQVTVESTVPVHAGASEKAPVIGTAEPGQVYTWTSTSADGTLQGIEWPDGESTGFGWVPAASVATARGEAETASAPIWRPASLAPRITIDATDLVSSADAIELSGTIEDDVEVLDYRVYLFHRDGTRTHAQKLDYGVGGRRDKRFAFDVPLRSGVNRVTVVARDDGKLESSHTVYISRPE